MGVGVVPERLDERMALERCLHQAALNSASSSVHQTHLRQPRRRGDVEILFDNRHDIARREGVQVE